MESKKLSNRIAGIVRLHQMLNKWKKLAVAPKNNSKKSINFLKRTLSLSDVSSAFYGVNIPKGCLAVCVGEEMKRFVIPMQYLSHWAFRVLLTEAEEEFGFQQQGVLRIPCQVSAFESILNVVEKNKKKNTKNGIRHCSSEAELGLLYHPQEPLCR